MAPSSAAPGRPASVDVAVVGAGLVGCAVARALAGGARVAVFERAARAGRAASSAAAGLLAPQMEGAYGLLAADGAERAMLDLCLASRSLFPAFLRSLEEETGRTIGYGSEGALVVALDEGARERLEATAVRQRERGLAAELVDGERARRLEPGLSGDVVAALLLPDDHRVDAPALAGAAAAAVAGDPRIALRLDSPVDAVATAGSRVAGVAVRGRTVAADRVIVAAGAWSGRLGGLPRPLPVRPVKGQMGGVPVPTPPLVHIVAVPGAYAVPADDRVLVGATMEEAGFDRTASTTAVAGLVEALSGALSSLAGVEPIEAWAGLRPATPDGLPVLGADPDVDGLFYATGHFRNGILLAPVTAAALAAVVEGREPPVGLAAFRPDRFGERV